MSILRSSARHSSAFRRSSEHYNVVLMAARILLSCQDKKLTSLIKLIRPMAHLADLTKVASSASAALLDARRILVTNLSYVTDLPRGFASQ